MEISEKRYQTIKEFFSKMSSCKTIDDIPNIPIMKSQEDYEEFIVKNLIRCGAIPKEKLEIGKTYLGSCRNSEEATWLGNCFEYTREKFGIKFPEKINHFEDDNGYDLFIPIKIKE